MIKVNSIETTAVPGYASVTIGFPGAHTPAPISPTPEPVKQPTLAPIDPPTLAPVKPPTSAPINPQTPLPIILPTPVPVNLPTSTPVILLTMVSANLPTSAHINPLTTAPINLPTSTPVKPLTSASMKSTLAPINQPILAIFDSPTSTSFTPPTSAHVQPTAAPVGKPTDQCGPGEAEVKLIIKTDYWGYETSCQFLTGTNIIKRRSNNYYENQKTRNDDIGRVNKNAVHNFMIQDIYRDGIYSNSGYWLYLESALVFSGYNFKNSATHTIPSNFKFFTLKLKTDNYSGETSWDLKNNGSIILSKGKYTYRSKKTYEETLLISSDCHTFSIKCSWGDGICCGHGEGLYEVYYNGELTKQGGDFGFLRAPLFQAPVLHLWQVILAVV